MLFSLHMEIAFHVNTNLRQVHLAVYIYMDEAFSYIRRQTFDKPELCPYK